MRLKALQHTATHCKTLHVRETHRNTIVSHCNPSQCSDLQPHTLLARYQKNYQSLCVCLSKSYRKGSHFVYYLCQWVGRKAYCNTLQHSVLRRSQDRFLRQKIERFFWRDFSGEEFREKHYCPYSFVPIDWLWSGFIFPELEHL